jgi:hypothetical protein
MIAMNKIIAVLALLLVSGSWLAAQHVMPPGMSHEEHLRQLQKEQDLKNRGALAMGFDQETSEHHFLLRKNGGAIVVVSRDAGDHQQIALIRSHLREIARAFADGSFEKPIATHAELPPGAAMMQEKKKRITYRYVEQPAGGSVVIESNDTAARQAIHEFLQYQITEHKTGDPLTAQ